jgi:hypothetical protein
MELNGKKKVWYCRLCPQPCSTAWNLKIHIQRKHHWKGESVKSGLMTNTTRQFTPDTRNSIKHNSYSDTSHYRNHHKAYHQPYGFSEGSSRNEEEQKPKKKELLDEVHETLRKMVEDNKKIIEIQGFKRQLFPYLQQPTILHGVSFGSVTPPSFTDFPRSLRTNPHEVIDALKDNIIALKGFVCRSCLGSMVVPIYRSAEINKIDPKHVCDAKRIAKIQHLDDNERQIMVDDLNRKLREEMKIAVKLWTGNTTYLISLGLLEMKENSIDMITLRPDGPNHWINRAMTEGQTVLDDNELMEYLRAGSNTTEFEEDTIKTFKAFHFNLIKKVGSHTYSYRMLISNIHLNDQKIKQFKSRFFDI